MQTDDRIQRRIWITSHALDAVPQILDLDWECSNAYLYTELGSDLCAFGVSEFHAEKLLAILQHELPLQ